MVMPLDNLRSVRERDMSPFASAGPTLIARGYSAIPIAPGDKIPGLMAGEEWRFHKGWNRYCSELPGRFQVDMWKRWPRAGVGVACGRGLIAVDIDRDELVAPILAVLPERLVAKRGRKGETIFFRGDTDKLRSRGFKIDGHGVLDFLSFGKQTVLPPSLHPATGIPYEWTTERTLLDTPLKDLPELTEAHFEAIVAVLTENGYKAEPSFEAAGPVESTSDAADFFRRLNEDALANLDAWVPKVGLYMPRREPDGSWRAIAEWRPSSSGKALHRRSRNLSIDRRGIKDFGDADKTYTALNVVMRVMSLSQSDVDLAARWLGEAIGYDFSPKMVLTSKPKAAPKPEPPPAVVDNPRPAEVAVDSMLARAARDAREPACVPANDDFEAVGNPPSRIKPFDVAGEPGLLGEIARWMMTVFYRPIPEFAMLGSIALLSVIFGRRFETPTGSGLNLYLVGLASTAAGKDDALDAAQTLLEECGMWHLIGPQDITSDSSIETALRASPCFLMPMDEIGVFLQGMSARNAGGFEKRVRKAFLELYSKSTKRWSGKQRADPSLINSQAPIFCPTISILGFSVVDGFYDGLTEQNLSDGFVNRLTVVMPEGKVESNTMRPRVTVPAGLVASVKEAASAAAEMAGNLAAVAARTPNMKPLLNRIGWESDAVRKHWFAIEQRQLVAIDRDPSIQGVIGRSAEQTLKLASIRALSRDPASPAVALSDVEWAYEIVLASIENIKQGVSDHMAGSDFEALVKCIERYARQAGGEGIAWSDLTRRKGVSKAEPRLVEAAIKRLVEQQVIFDPEAANPKAGRPGKRIRARFEGE